MQPISKNLEGILWMIAACVFSACMVGIVRHLSYSFHAFQNVFFRSSFSFLLFLPWIAKNGIGVIKTTKLPQYCFRAACGLCAMLMCFYAVSSVPLAEVTALSFTAPLIATLFAIILFKEKTNIYRIMALVGGFIGTLIILRPGFAGFNPLSLLVIGSAILWATTRLMVKSLTRTEKPEVVVFYLMAIMTPFSLPVALLHWKNPAGMQWVELVFLGAFSCLFQYSLSNSLAKADLTVVLPFDFLRLLFTSLVAYFFFAEVIDFLTLLGGAIILGSTVMVTWHEARLKKKALLKMQKP